MPLISISYSSHERSWRVFSRLEEPRVSQYFAQGWRSNILSRVSRYFIFLARFGEVFFISMVTSIRSHPSRNQEEISR